MNRAITVRTNPEKIADKDFWVTKDLIAIPIKALGTAHLQHIIWGLKGGNPYYKQSWKKEYLEAELNSRTLLDQ